LGDYLRRDAVGCRVGVVIPARNEANHIGQVVGSVPPFVDCFVVTDDGSEDRTASIASNCGDDRVVVVRHPVALGLAGLVRGYKGGLRDVDVAVVIRGPAVMWTTCSGWRAGGL
jgi:hypothetical protein